MKIDIKKYLITYNHFGKWTTFLTYTHPKLKNKSKMEKFSATKETHPIGSL